MSSEEKENHFRLLLLLLDGAALVERKIFDSKVTGTLSTFLSTHNNVLNALHKKKAINSIQWTLLNCGIPSSADFDISLLTCLLRNICGLATHSDTVWTNPGVNDFSTEADITRLKGHRNMISHQPGVGISLTNFRKEWRDICQVLHRLNQGLLTDGITDLQTQLDDYETGCIDISTANRYENKLRDYKELEIAQQSIVLEEITAMKEQIQNNLEEIRKSLLEQNQTTVLQHERTREFMKEQTTTITKKLDELTLSPEQDHLKKCSKDYFGEAGEKKNVFVKTIRYEEAKDKLWTSGIVVLSGHPGEGKTTMANMLLLETSPSDKILKLVRPSDLHLIPRGYTSILIDDIFGHNSLNDQLLCPWDSVFPDLNMLVRKKHIAAAVITTRHYIWKEAMTRLSAKELFDQIVILSSEDMSQYERRNILNKHLNATGKVMDEREKIQICSTEGGDDEKQMIGFPVCTEMFTTNDDLFAKGSEFFKKPYEYFLQCLKGISGNEDKFMSLILVWSNDSHVFNVSQLEPENMSKLVNVADDFSYTKLRDNAILLREHLKQLEECFLTYDDHEGTYSFRHQTIADAVGIVAACKHKENAVIKYGNMSFIMSHVTCSTSDDSGKRIKLMKRNYKALVNKIDRLLFVEGQLDTHDDIKHQSQLPALSGMIVSTSNISILQHEVFDNIDFVKEYLNSERKDVLDNCLGKPIVFANNHFKPEYQISFQDGQMPLCMSSALQALGKDTMVKECLLRKLLSKAEKDVALLLAVKNNCGELVNDLLKSDIVISEKSLQIASKDSVDSDVYKLLIGQRIALEGTLFDDGVKYVESRGGILVGAVDGDEEMSSKSQSRSRSKRPYIYGDVLLYVLGCKLLVGSKANVLPMESFDRQMTQSVYLSGWEEFVQKLMEYDPQEHLGLISRESLLNVIARYAETTLVQILLAYDPFDWYTRLMKSKIGRQSLFHKAVVEGDELLLQAAIALGLNPNRRDVYGRSPICLAASYGKDKFVKTLSRIPNIDIELADRNGFTPLLAAVWSNRENTVSLLEPLVNVNCRDNRGNTPLHLACRNGNNVIIKILLENPMLDVRVVNKCGETVYQTLRSFCLSTNNPKKKFKQLTKWFKLLKKEVPVMNRELAKRVK